MFDFGVLTNKVKGAMKAILKESSLDTKAKDEYLHIIETDYGHENHERKAGNLNYILSN